MGALKWWGNLSTGLMNVSCSFSLGWFGVRKTFPYQSGEQGHESSFAFFYPLPLQSAAFLTSWIIQATIKASGISDYSCFLLVKHRLVSRELQSFTLIEPFGFNIWVSLLNVKAWGKQGSHEVILWCSSQCLRGSRGRSCLCFRERQKLNKLWRALDGKIGSVWLIQQK